MRAKLVGFPIKGSNWCFTRSIDSLLFGLGHSSSSPSTPSTLRDLWKSLSSNSQPLCANAELLIDFVSIKAPERSFKNKIYGVGMFLLARIKPCETFLKSISKEVKGVEVTYPESLNARLVRRRLRHIAISGEIIHKKYLYGSASLLPVTTVFMGSEKLIQLVSDGSINRGANTNEADKNHYDSQLESQKTLKPPLDLRPSKELEELIQQGSTEDGLKQRALTNICKSFELNLVEVLKYEKL